MEMAYIQTPSALAKQSQSQTNQTNTIDIVFKELTYTVDALNRQASQANLIQSVYYPKDILRCVSGIFKGGQVSAILGSSGAGKTTLLNAIACRLPLNNMRGAISANGVDYTADNFGDFANYVMQQDILIHTLTVRETLQFAADLRLETTQQKKTRVFNDLSKALKLEQCMDTLVGNHQIKGISGGEKKRTSIAFELVSDPQVIILDQPTSGLDSLTAFVIVKHLQKLAHEQGKTIIMTIHQPSSEIFALFDYLVLMASGAIIYQGKSQQAVQYFRQTYGSECPSFSTPGQFLISMAHQDNLHDTQRNIYYCSTYQSALGWAVAQRIAEVKTSPIRPRVVNITFLTVLGALLKRGAKNVIRSRALFVGRLIQTIFVALFTGGLYHRFTGEYTSLENWRALSGQAFLFAVGGIFLDLSPVSITFPLQRPIFLKEQSSKLYSTGSYFLARCIIDIPSILFFSLLFASISYWLMGLSNTAVQFFTFYLTGMVLAFTGNSVGLLIGSLLEDARSAHNVNNLFLTMFFLFGGYFKNRSNIPSWISWLEYLSPVKYGFFAFLQNQVRYATESNVGQFNFDLGIYDSIGFLVVLAVGYRLIALLMLWLLRSQLQ